MLAFAKEHRERRLLLGSPIESEKSASSAPPSGSGAPAGKRPDPFSLVLSWAGANKRYLFASVACASVAGLMTMVGYLGVFNIMRAAYEGTCTSSTLRDNALLTAVGCVLQYACFAASSVLSHKGAYKTLFDVRCRVMDHLAHAPLGALDERGVGRIKTVLVEDVERLELFLAHSIPEAFMYLTGPVAAFAFLCSVNAPLALATLVPFACALVILGVIFSRMSKVMERATAALARMNAVMVEYVGGMRTVKALDMGTASFARFRRAIDEEHGLWCEIARKTGPGYAAYLVVIECGLLIMVPLGGWMFATGAVAGSTYLLFAFVGSLYLTEIRLLQEIGTKLAQVGSGARRVQELLDVPAFGGGRPFPDRADIELSGVGFSYDGSVEVLGGIDLSVREGERLAVVGPSGAGKSTMVELVSRFYDATAGTVRIGGVDVRDIDYDDLLRNVAVVFQKTFLTSGSILENIRMGSDASLEEVREAARLARIDDFVMGLPQGYDTEMGSLGNRVSGGQRQRIAIARAILKDAPILILDEATSAADPENQLEIDAAIANLSAGKTVIVVAHRLGVVRTCDRVAVVEAGRLSCVGEHEEMLRRCPYYARAWADYDRARSLEIGFGASASASAPAAGTPASGASAPDPVPAPDPLAPPDPSAPSFVAPAAGARAASAEPLAGKEARHA